MNYLEQTIIAILDEKDALNKDEISSHLENLGNWELFFDDSTGYFIKRIFAFDDSDKGREYMAELKKQAEEVHASPQIDLTGTDVAVKCYNTHIDGLHLNEIIMAAHADELYERWDIITGERDRVTQASDESFPASDPPGY